MNRFIASTALALVLAAPPAFAQNGNASGNAAPAQQAGQQHESGVPGQIRITSADSLAGRAVFDDNGNRIGRIDYLTIDPQTGKITAVLIGSGGQLNIGNDVIPVPWSNLWLDPGNNDRVTFAAGLQKLQQGKKFSLQQIQQLTDPLMLAQITDYYVPAGQGTGNSGGKQAANGASAQADRNSGNKGQDQAQARPERNQQPDRNQQHAAQAQNPQNGKAGQHQAILVARDVTTILAPPALVSPDDLRGMDVRARNGDDIGQIDRIMIDTQRGEVAYLLLSSGGFLGMGDEWVPVPLQALSWAPNDREFMLNADEGRVKQMKPLQKSELPVRVSGADLKKLYDRFGVTPYWQQS